ncbi:MAG: dephospho-CoA kinase [Caldimonas sp.]
MDGARLSLRIGLTGGIGSGKSTVAAMLAGHGARVIDTDLIARELTLPGGSAIEAIRASFGARFIAGDGSLDRSRMRELAFGDVAQRGRLEAILHPLIGDEVERHEAATPAAPVVIFAVPLLVESGRWRARVDRVWLVDCAESLQIERVMARSGWSAEAVRAVLAQQAPRLARRAAADAVIDNDGISLAQLALQVHELWTFATGTGAEVPPQRDGESL